MNRICIHGVWKYGKTLSAMHCVDYRRCLMCGSTAYKQQWQTWPA